MKKKVLHLSVSKQWYDLIAGGEKKEEYREIKPYWAKRLVNKKANSGFIGFDEYGTFTVVFGKPEYIPFTHILFTNGYGKNMPHVEKEIESITIGKPKRGWCPEEFLDKEYFVIKLK